MGFSGFGFRGFRGFSNNSVRIAPLEKISLIAGRNNSGKSNIITFLDEYLDPLLASLRGNRSGGPIFDPLDSPQNTSNVTFDVAFPLSKSDEAINDYLNDKMGGRDLSQKMILRKLLTSGILEEDDRSYWFVYQTQSLNGNYKHTVDPEDVKSVLSPQEIQILWNAMTGRSGGGIDAHWVPELVQAIPALPQSIPNTEVIPAIRNIGDPGSQPNDFSGIGIIERLAKLQNPGVTERKERQKFDRINEFLRVVTEKPNAEIEIPYERDAILVHMDDRILPLSSLGTGIHEVIILAAAATILEDTIVCIEEPELHLHPTLQRRLVEYISNTSSNQYVFSTHSGHLLDTPAANIFHVRQVQDNTAVEYIGSKRSRSAACHDLGLRASDIVQANCTIWVEGPSDRVYLNHWLKRFCKEIEEGIHYSIMFYGGKLFSHISAIDRDEVTLDDFISIVELNRWSAIMFDSDRRKPSARLSATKKRLIREFESGNGIAWVTNGREIENYIPPAHMRDCIKAVHTSVSFDQEVPNKYENALEYQFKGERRTADKVKVARYYVRNFEPDFACLDLRKKLKEVEAFILAANGLNND